LTRAPPPHCEVRGLRPRHFPPRREGYGSGG
jgi:hypothetical protein